MLSDQPLLPQANLIQQDLAFMTRRWHMLPERPWLEVRAFKEDFQPQTAKFRHDDLDDAVEWIEDMNGRGYNMYAVRNPIRDGVSKSAKDEDILAAFFLWADCDDPAAAGNVRRFDGPKWSAAVTTGTIPDTRVHIYWELEEPCMDLTAWRQMQETVAAHFNSDRTVVNPSRIMRIGGTVSYPFKHKVERGYVKQITGIRTEYADERPRVTLEQMTRVFGDRTPAAPATSGISIATGPMPMDRERAAIQALSGQEWNNAVLRLVGSYVRKGLADSEIHVLTDPLTLGGYTVEQTRAEVQDMINRTRANPKFEGAGADPIPEPVKATPEAITSFNIDSSADFLSDLKPLEYLVDGILPAGVAYSLTGHAGHGKTTLALQFAISVAQGENFHDRATSKGSVLILAGENPYNVKWQYAAALAAKDIKPQDIDIHFVQGRFSINQWTEVLRSKMEQMPDLKLVIVDSLQAFFEGDNDNDNTQMVEMAHKLRAMCKTTHRPALLIIAHPAGKTPSKDNLVPRGGGAFLNEIDGNLTVWSEDASQQTLHHSQKFRGASFDPLEWVMQIHEFDHLTDIHGTPLKLPVSRPEMTIERANREQQTDTYLREYLDSVEQEKPLSVREGASRFGISQWRFRQIIQTAKDEKLIKRYAKTYRITDGGKEFLHGDI